MEFVDIEQGIVLVLVSGVLLAFSKCN